MIRTVGIASACGIATTLMSACTAVPPTAAQIAPACELGARGCSPAYPAYHIERQDIMIMLIVLVFSAANVTHAPDWIGTQLFDTKDQCLVVAGSVDDRADKSGVLKTFTYCIPPDDLIAVNPELATPKQ